MKRAVGHLLSEEGSHWMKSRADGGPSSPKLCTSNICIQDAWCIQLIASHYNRCPTILFIFRQFYQVQPSLPLKILHTFSIFPLYRRDPPARSGPKQGIFLTIIWTKFLYTLDSCLARLLVKTIYHERWPGLHTWLEISFQFRCIHLLSDNPVPSR